MRVRRFLSRACIASSAALMVVAVVGPPTSAQENPDAGRPTYWEAKTFARAVQFQVNTNPLLIPFQDLVRLDFAEGDGNWSAFGEARGRASALWPGDAVSKGPAAFCANGLPCPDGFPPAWPLSVTAEGSQADATMEGGQTFGDGPFTGKAMEARAHAARDYVETVATYQGLSIADTGGISKQVAENVAGPLRQVARELDAGVRQASGELDGAFRQLIAPFAEGGLPVLISPSFAVGGVIPGFEKALTFQTDDVLFSVESVKAITRMEFSPDNKVLISRAETVLNGVRLFGGLVEAGQIVTSAVSQTDGNVVSDAAHTSKVTGLTVAGVPAGLTETGITMGADGLLAGRDEADIDVKVENVLGRTGLELRLVGTDETVTPGNVTSGATGVLVHVQPDLTRLPAGAIFFTTLTLGNVGTLAQAPPPFELPPLTGGDGGFTSGGFTSGGFTSGGFTSGTDVLSGSAGGGDDFEFQPEEGDFVAAPPGSGADAQGAFGPFGDGLTRLIPTELLRGLTADRMTLFYLAWIAGGLGLVLGSRLPGVRLVAPER